MKIFENNRCQEAISSLMYWMLFIVALSFGVIATSILVSNRVATATEIPDNLEELILASRFYNLPECFAYQDQNGRVHPRVIDIAKFNSDTMKKCFPNEEANYAFSLSLNAPDIGLNLRTLNTPNWKGEYSSKEFVKDVLVLKDNVKYIGTMKIKVKNV